MKKIFRFQEFLKHQIERADKELASFAKSFAEHPLHALEWSADLFGKAAQKQVAEHWLQSTSAWHQALTDGTASEHQPKNEDEAIEFIKTHLTREVTRGAMYLKQSTSPTSNLASNSLLSASADLLDHLQSY